MPIKSSKVLLRTFLTFTLFALLLIPQIGRPGSAFAAPSAVPENLNCLDVTSSSLAGTQTVTVANPPGGGVKYTAYLYVKNNCTTDNPVSSVTINTTTLITCQEANGNSQGTNSYQIPDLVQGRRLGKIVIAIGSCIVSENGVPTASVLPTSIQINIDATGTSASGQQVGAPGAVLNVTW